jgi:hypothetical protein
MNSYVVNLYPQPTPGATSQRLLPTTVAEATFGALQERTKAVSFDVQGTDVFMTIDESPPSATNGHRLYAGRAYTISDNAAKKARFLAASGTPAIFASELTV